MYHSTQNYHNFVSSTYFSIIHNLNYVQYENDVTTKFSISYLLSSNVETLKEISFLQFLPSYNSETFAAPFLNLIE